MDLFVYGTLMLPEIMHAVSGYAGTGMPARLHHHRRRCLIGESYPAIVPQRGEHVDGVLYRGLSVRQVRLLDRFEGSMYQRVTVAVESRDGVSLAAVYRLAPAYRRRLHHVAWSLQQFVARDRKAFVSGYRGFRGRHTCRSGYE